jgi:hypothetical protein
VVAVEGLGIIASEQDYALLVSDILLSSRIPERRRIPSKARGKSFDYAFE